MGDVIEGADAAAAQQQLAQQPKHCTEAFGAHPLNFGGFKYMDPVDGLHCSSLIGLLITHSPLGNHHAPSTNQFDSLPLLLPLSPAFCCKVSNKIQIVKHHFLSPSSLPQPRLVCLASTYIFTCTTVGSTKSWSFVSGRCRDISSPRLLFFDARCVG